MKKIDIGQTAQILANIGVIAGIVFLAVEIAQNSETQRMAVTHQVLGTTANMNAAYLSDPEVIDLLLTQQGGQALSQRDIVKMNVFFRARMTNYWQVFLQYESGYLDEDVFAAYERALVMVMSNRRFPEWWNNGKSIFSTSFQSYVDGLATRSSP